MEASSSQRGSSDAGGKQWTPTTLSLKISARMLTVRACALLIYSSVFL